MSLLRTFIKSYLAEMLLIWLAVAFYFKNPLHKNFFPHDVKSALLLMAVIYSFVSLILIYKKASKKEETRAVLLLRFIKNILIKYINFRGKAIDAKSQNLISEDEKTSLLFMLVKFFFIPVMTKFLFQNLHVFEAQLKYISAHPNCIFSSDSNHFFKAIIALLLLTDTFFFLFGYIVESGILGSKVKSVDTSFSGWLAAMFCYPPFNKISATIFPVSDSYNFIFINDFFTVFIKIIVVILLFIFTLSSLSLGAKCSNLTNRGIVSYGTYKFVRHPAYTSKVLMWWVLALPFIANKPFLIISLVFWTALYYIRAMTEENHLIKDPEYGHYCSKVRWRFIPGVY